MSKNGYGCNCTIIQKGLGASKPMGLKMGSSKSAKVNCELLSIYNMVFWCFSFYFKMCGLVL
jgi:hypothetical protein